MIGKVLKGKSFRGCLLYVMNDKIPKQENGQVMKDRGEVIVYNQCFGNAREMIEQFNDVRKLNHNISKPVLHISLSLSPGEKVTHDQWADMSRDCAKAFGFDNNQYVSILHKDSQHDHIHIVANRIGFDGKTLSDSHNYRIMAKLTRRLEEKHQLKQVLSPRRYLSGQERWLPRLDERKLQLKETIVQQLKISRSLQEFEQRMIHKGYRVNIGRGISFTDDKDVKVKGSDLNYSLTTIERILQQQTSLSQKHDIAQEKRLELMLNKERHKHHPNTLDHSREVKLFRQQQESMPDELNDTYRKRKRARGYGHGR